MASKKIECALCRRKFARITETHLKRFHPGVTLEDYRRAYGPITPGGVSSELMKRHGGELATMVLEQIKTDPSFLEDVAARTGNLLFSEEFRGKILGTTLMILMERAGSYQNLVGRLQTVEEELYQDHRILAGGPDGAPTETDTLLSMAKHAAGRVSGAEDALLRILKQAIDDRKSGEINLNLHQVFSGKHEHVHVPPSLNTHQREALRRVGSRLLRQPKTLEQVMETARKLGEDEVQVSDAKAKE